jgi:succinoglycan biosynthesis transport protein ExoP
MVSTSAFPPSYQEQDQEFGYGQLFQILLRRWPWIVGALGLSLAGAVYVNVQAEPEFQSSMQLLVEPNFDENWRVQDFNEQFQAPNSSSIDYATQLNLMRSNQFLLEAANRLLDSYSPEELRPITQSFNLVQVVEDKTSSRIFAATVKGNDPTITRRFLEELQQVYNEFNIQQREGRLTRGLAYVDEELEIAQQNLRASQNALEQFRINQNLIDPTAQAQSIAAALDRIQEEQRQLSSQLSEIETRYELIGDRLKLNPDTALLAARLSQSGRLQELLSTIQETSLELDERRILFTDADPTTQILAEKLQLQTDELQREVGLIIRRPVDRLSPDLLSFMQLSNLDIQLATELLQADANLAAIESRILALIDLEDSLRRDLDQLPALIAEYDRLLPNIEIQQATLQRLLEQREQVTSELARGGYTWQVVEPPQDGGQIGPNPRRNLILGGIVGLFLGGLLAFARESTDNVLHTSEDLKRQLTLPLLGILPLQTESGLFTFGAGRRDEALPPMLHPELAESELIQTISSPSFREAMDLMTNSLQLRSTDKAHKAFAITSGLPNEGKTTVALGLALSLARMNQKVLLIDSDLRRSGLQAQLGIASDSGLSTFLKGAPTATRPHRLDLGYAHLDILPAGPAPDDPIPLLSSPKFSRLLAKSRQIYDVILVDTPPVLGMADAVKVGSVCDGTVVVTRLDRITQPELTEMLSLLAPLKVMGVIANGAKVIPNRYVYDTPPAESKVISSRN